MRNSDSSQPGGLIRSGTDRKKTLLRNNVVLLLALTIIIFIVPLIPTNENLLSRILLGIVVLSGLFAADFSRPAFRILSSIGTLVIMVTLLNILFNDSQILSILTFTVNILFFVLVTIALVAHVASTKEVFSSTLLCAINSYLLIGLTLSVLFLVIELFFPGSFNQIEIGEGGFPTFIYFGFVTLTTLGYGDITPASHLAKTLSMFTALFGQLYLVIIMALIIGKYLKEK